MKVLLSHNLQGIGGGSSFMQNFMIGFNKYYPDVQFSYEYGCDDYDVYFVITPTSMMQEALNEVELCKNKGKRLVVRIDNIPLRSRNKRYRVWDKIVGLTNRADSVIYQSNWAKNYIAWGEIPAKGVVILNSINEEIFNTQGARKIFKTNEDGQEIYLIMISSSDPCKRLHESLAIFSERHKQAIIKDKTKPRLIIAGRIPDEYHVNKMNAGWDFVRGEDVEYIGELKTQKEVASVMRGCNVLIFPSYNDACPNTVIEAKACGLQVVGSMTGGTPECLEMSPQSRCLSRMITEYYKVFTNKFWDYEV